MTPSHHGPAGGSDALPDPTGGMGADDPDRAVPTGAAQSAGDRALGGWNILPLAVRIDGVQPYTLPGDPAGDEPAELVPTPRGIRSVLGYHRAVAACAEGPSYLQVAVLVDDDGRTATVGADGSVVAGDAVEELAATVHRMTGQLLEPVHPHLRRALVVHLDAPELPLLAAAAQVGLTAVSRDGWSVVIPDDENGWWALRTGLAEPAIAVSSDGSARSLEVLLGDEDPASYTDMDHVDAVCGLSWGPQWTAVSGAEDASAAAALTREVVGICGSRTTQVQIESVASVLDLDPVDTKRLANYVDGPSTPLVLESVLQLLGLPPLAAKIVEGAKDINDVEGVTHWEPGTTAQAFVQALTQKPTAAGVVPSLHRAVLKRPEILLAVAGLEVAAGTGLAALARRSGQAAPALGALSALAFTDAASMTAWYSAIRRRGGERR
ncbi:hypothetical protein [Kocuria sp.]|uniref:hypothetical protein n=1 Tax=Kocuria sp. TaxID=1871328 RepID=UPI0026E0AEEF|nr:hypothetical protein [Kocuria sp.]MDO5618300.1 hypothetical protein [Kocuria sp.]